MATQSSIHQLLASARVADLASSKSVVVVKSNESIVEGFTKLVQNNILSAPVFDLATNKYTGFLDIRDLVSFVVFIDDDQNSTAPNNLQDLIQRGAKLFKVPLDGVTVTYLSRRNQFHPVTEQQSVLEVCSLFAKGVHRVPIVNQQGEVVSIISQSNIIQFLNKHLAELKPEVQKKLGEIQIGSRPVLTVTQNTTAIDTFRLMDNKKISGVAVVEPGSNRLVGNTSASDLKLFLSTLSLDLLKNSIMQFLNIIRQESIDIRSPTITCSSQDSLAILIGKLASTKIHKIFIADDDKGFTPLAVVSITDVLKHLVDK